MVIASGAGARAGGGRCRGEAGVGRVFYGHIPGPARQGGRDPAKYPVVSLAQLPPLRNRTGSKSNTNLCTPRGQAPGRVIRKNRYSTTVDVFVNTLIKKIIGIFY
jgi:hypothetical protein